MRPLFAIAPLALAFSLLGPSSQASSTADSSWAQTFAAWASGARDEDKAPALLRTRVADERSFESGITSR